MLILGSKEDQPIITMKKQIQLIGMSILDKLKQRD
jgi:hypothetical protein